MPRVSTGQRTVVALRGTISPKDLGTKLASSPPFGPLRLTRSPLVTCGAGLLEGDDPREAVEGFKQVVSMEQEKGEW